MALVRHDSLEPAEKMFRKASSLLLPSCYTSRLNLGWILCQRGQHSEAGVLLRRAISLHPKCWMAHCLLAYAAAVQDKPVSSRRSDRSVPWSQRIPGRSS